MATTKLREALSLMAKKKGGSVHGRFSHLLESNNPPIDEESRFIRDLIQQMITEAQILQTKIESEHWPWKRAILRSRIGKLNRYIGRYTCVLSIVRVIPTEIIQHIFLLSTTNPWTLSHICKLWRRYAHTFPALWTLLPKFVLRPLPSRKATVELKMLVARLRHTSNAPLDISICVDTSACSMDKKNLQALSTNPILALLVSHSNRWRTAEISLPPLVVASLCPALKGHLLSLQGLYLTFTLTYRDDSLDKYLEIHTFSDTPLLKTARISGYFPGKVVLTAPNLSNLTRRWPSPLAISSIAHFTSLECLSLTFSWPIHSSLPLVSVPAVPLMLPLLKYLSCELLGDPDFVLIQSLIIPSITDMSLQVPEQGGFQDVVALLIRSGQQTNPTLRRFELRYRAWLIESGAVIGLLKLMPNLEKLAISMPHVDDIQALAKVDFDGPGGVLVPRLERCAFIFEAVHARLPEGPSKELYATIKQVARNRCETPRRRAEDAISPINHHDSSLDVHPLQLLELGGRFFFYSAPSLAVTSFTQLRANPLYTQADLEDWPIPTSMENSTIQPVIDLNNALLEEMPYLYCGTIALFDATDDACRQRVDAILNKLDAMEVGAFDLLTSNIYFTIDKLTTQNTVHLRMMFHKADTLVARWSALIAPHLNEVHWVYTKPDYPQHHDDFGNLPGMVYVRSNHPIRASKEMDDAVKKYDKSIFV